MNYVELSMSEWSLTLITIIVVIALILFYAFPKLIIVLDEAEPFQPVPLCEFFMDGMLLEPGDQVKLDGSIITLREDTAHFFNNGHLGCTGVMVVSLNRSRS